MKALIRWLVDHATTVILAVISVFVFGTISWVTLPRESSPDITIPVVLVTTPYIGVSPEDIEGLISIPMERELSTIKGIKELRSTSAEGVSVVAIEFEPDVVIEDALQRVRDRVSRVRPDLPSDVEEPSVREISFSDIPVVLVTLAGTKDESVLEDLVEDLQDEVSRIPGVLDAKISGDSEREIKVQVIPERLAHYGLALHDVISAIQNENVNIPGGNVPIGQGDVLLRVPGEFTEVEQVENVAIKRVGDRPVFVRDVARVLDGYADRESYSRMAGQASVTLSVTKRAGANILEVASAVKAAAARHAEAWPDGVEYRVLGDQSRYIEAQVTDLQNNIITALLLVVAVLVFSMGVRNSLFVAVAIPLSMLMSFMILDVLGFTLNMVVLFSLILALGMLVDNGIVIVENVYRHAEMGKDRRTAAIDGTAEVALAVLASTATTVAAFLPLAFWSGIMGKFMGFLPKTVITVLTCSLVVALCVLPVMMSRLMPSVAEETNKPEFIRDLELPWLMRAYRQVLWWSIRLRYLAVAGGVGMLVGTFGIYALLNHGTEFFPNTDPDRVNIGVRLPQGTDLEATDRVVRRIEGILAREPNVDTWVAQSGVSAGGDALRGSNSAPNEARITVDYHPDPNNVRPGERPRMESTRLTTDRLRAAVAEIPGARIAIEPEGMGPPVGPDVEVLVSGDDFDQVGLVAQRFRRELAKIEGITDLEDDYRVGRPELRLRIDRGAAARVGVSTAAIGNAVRTAVAGTTASALREGEDEYDIVVELAPEYREDLQSVLDLRLPGREDTSPNTFPVPLSAVATYELAGGSGAIQHIDQDLVVTITGDVLASYNVNEVQKQVEALIAAFDAPPGIHLRMGGSDQEQREAQAFLGRAFLIAVALISLVLVTQFDSVAVPFIIMCTVILSLIGVLWGLLLTGTPFGIIMTGIGVISLAGVVVNNAIVLLDYVQQLEARGIPTREALVEAGLTRFRPVMLTAVTTILGLIPMALGASIDFSNLRLVVGSTSAQWWGPMAVAVIFGLAFATVLTLVMVPTLYSIYDDLRTLRSRLPLGSKASAAAAGALMLLAPGNAEAVTLEEAWKAAEQHNIALQIAREQAIQTSTLRAKAWSTVQPRIETSATYVLNSQEIAIDFADTIPPAFADFIDPDDLPPPTVVQKKSFWQADLTVSQRLFSGTAPPLLKGARALHRAAWLQVERAEQQMRVGVTRAYWGLWTAQQAESVAAEALTMAQNQAELAQRQVTAGLAPARARIQAELGVARAQRELKQAREALVSAREAFYLATSLRDAVVEQPPPFTVPSDLERTLTRVESRSDVQAAALHEVAAQAHVTGKKMQWLPVVDGQFSYVFDDNASFGAQPTFWRASLRASWTLWDGGLRLAEQRELASQKRAAELQRRHLVMEAEQDVRVSWEGYLRARAAVTSVERELELARENLRLAEASFAAGGATWLEVEEARLGLRAAELNHLREQMSQEIAAVELLASAGML